MSPATRRPPRPVAPRVPSQRTLFGDTLVDPFAWMRDTGDPAFRAYVDAENAWCAAWSAPRQALTTTLEGELRARWAVVHETVPVVRGAWQYWQRTGEGQDFPVYLRAPVGGGAEQVLLDLNAEAAATGYAALHGFEVSDDGDLLIYGIDTTGSYDFTLHLIDLRTGQPAGPPILHAVDPIFAGIPAAGEAQVLWYVEEDISQGRPWRVRAHRVGSDPSTDAVVYEEADARFLVDLSRSRRGGLVMVNVGSTSTTEVHLLRADAPDAAPRLVAARQAGVRYAVDEGADDSLYILTNEGAPGQRLLRASLADLGRASWVELIGERPGMVLEAVEVFAQHLILRGRVDGAPALAAFDPQSRALRPIPLPASLGALSVEPNPDFGSTVYRYGFSSPVTAPTVMEQDTTTGQSRVLQQVELPSPVDAAAYEVLRAHATAEDGTPIPLSIVRRRGQRHAGPGLLYAYGAYAWPVDDRYDPTLFSLLDRGFVYVVAHVRGGGEGGSAWHDAGRLLVKRNTFSDLLASAEWLFAHHIVPRGALALKGLSAGGLTAFAALNASPETFACVVGQAPFVDVLHTMLDPTVPGTVPDYEEWGDPQQVAFYQTIRAYSPYDNLRPVAFPPILITSALHDSQVPVWNPTRFVAKLRLLHRGRHPVLLSVTTTAGGHGGASSVSGRVASEAFWLSFVIDSLGRDEADRSG